MKKTIQMQQQIHSPTLNTVMMVEKALINMPGSVMTIPQLKRSLPKQVNHNTLISILEYLERSNKIIVGLKGITWIFNPSLKLKAAIAKGLEL